MPEIARTLFLSAGTVRNHLAAITQELGAGSRAEAHRIAPAPRGGTPAHVVGVGGGWGVGPTGAEVELDPGDYVRFAGDRPHHYAALAPGSSAVLVMEYV